VKNLAFDTSKNIPNALVFFEELLYQYIEN